MTTRIAGPLALLLWFLGFLFLDASTSLLGRLAGHLFMLGCLFLYVWPLRNEKGPGWGAVLVTVIVSVATMTFGEPVFGCYLLAFGLVTAVNKFRQAKR